MACADDTPVEGTVALVRLLSGRSFNYGEDRLYQYGVSGRSEAARDLTLDWFTRHDVPLDDLFLRPAGDHTPNSQYKVGVIRELRVSEVEVVLFVEDCAESAEYIRAETGVPVLLVQGDYLDATEANV